MQQPNWNKFPKQLQNLYVPKHNFSLVALHSAGHQLREAGYYYPGEHHDFWEMCYVQRGTITITEDDRVYKLYPNDAIFNRPWEFHTLKVEDGSEALFSIISFRYNGSEIDPLGKGVIKLSSNYAETVNNIIRESSEAFDFFKDTDIIEKKKENYSSIYERLVMLQTECFLLSLLNDMNLKDRQDNTVAAMHYKKVVNVLKEHIYEKLTVEQIATLCHVSRSNLKKIFKTYTGYGVIQYFNKMKIIKSIDMLKSGMTVSEISDKLDFSSPSYFSNAFKRETGFFPTAYKNEVIKITKD